MDDYKQVIAETTLLGLPLYKRVYLEEYQVQITARQNITEYPGLVVISNKPAIIFNKISLESSLKNWGEVVQESIELTLLNLIINGFIHLTTFIDRKSYIGGLIKFNSDEYYLTVAKTYSGPDYLSACIVKSIKAVEEKFSKKTDIYQAIHHLVNEQIGTTKYVRPSRDFFASIINGYEDKAPMTFQNHSKFLGEYSRFEVTFTAEQKAQLKTAYKYLNDTSETLKKESKHFNSYNKKLYEFIYEDIGE